MRKKGILLYVVEVIDTIMVILFKGPVITNNARTHNKIWIIICKHENNFLSTYPQTSISPCLPKYNIKIQH